MKARGIFTVVLFALVCTSCYIDGLDTIYGNGNVVSEERTVGNFDKLKVSTGIDVYIRQGDENALLLEADENLHEVIVTDVVDNTLKIYSRENIRKAKARNVYLVYEDLNSIKVSSAGDVIGKNTLKTDIMDLSLSSAGDLKLDIEADKVICSISSSGDARLSGNTGYLDANLSSAGNLYAFELKAEKCKVQCSSAGSARVNASEEFDLKCSSAGSIHYKGDGRVTTSSSSSAGSIIRK